MRHMQSESGETAYKEKERRDPRATYDTRVQVVHALCAADTGSPRCF